MNQKLRHDRDDMDHTIELERAKMDCKNMQARADMDQKLRQKREEIESKAVLEQVNQEAKIMQDHERIDRKVHFFISYFVHHFANQHTMTII
jgi:hypothetical protein